MTKTWRSVLGLVLIMGTTACHTDSITNANQNPNDPTSAPPGALFTNAAITSVRRWTGFGSVAVLAQHFSSVLYPTVDSYLTLQATNTNGSFTSAYTSDLADFRQVIQVGRAAGNAGI